MKHTTKALTALVTAILFLPTLAYAAGPDGNCSGLPTYGKLKEKLDQAVAQEATGLNLHMWATVVNRDGVVCAIAFSGTHRGAQWPGSRVISAQKANTANSFSLDKTSSSAGSGRPLGLALSTANLYSAVQPGGSLFGLQESNPVNHEAAYKGPSSLFGSSNDPLVGEKVGGVNVFGGGLGLYGEGQFLLGGLGLSGDTSCSDHYIAWRLRHLLELDHMQGVQGVSGDGARPDNIVFDITENPAGGTGKSLNGFGHPNCGGLPAPNTLPAVQP